MITNEELEWIVQRADDEIADIASELIAARKVVEAFRDSLMTWDTDLTIGVQHPVLKEYDDTVEG